MSFGTCRMTELNFREVFRCFHQERFMTEGIGENDVAALVDEVDGRFLALRVFRDRILLNEFDALSFTGRFRAVLS